MVLSVPQSIEHKEGFYQHLFTEVYKPEGAGPYPLVVCFHGIFSSHQELGSELPRQLAQEGFAALLFDFRGHGKSKGERGIISLNSLFEDSRLIIKMAKDFPWVDKNQIYGLGHSLGTTAVLKNHQDFAGLILVSPTAHLMNNLSFLEKIFYPLLYYFLSIPYDFLRRFLYLPFFFSIPYKIRKRDLFKSKEAAKKAPFELQNFIPASTYHLLKEHDNLILAKEVGEPTLILAGRYDKITGIKEAQIIYRSLKSPDKELIELEQSGHSCFFDQEAELVIKKILAWLKRVKTK